MDRHCLPCGNEALLPRVYSCLAVARLLMLSLLAVMAVPAIAEAGQIIISWDRSPEAKVAGYRIYNAPEGQPFTTPIEVGNTSFHMLSGLDTGIAYHAAVTAYDVLGQESPLSAQVVYHPREDGDPGGDMDQDGLTDFLEAEGCTDPTDADTDDDGLDDGFEDADRDGVRDEAETSSCAADSDGDGLQDGTELGYTAAGVGPDTDLAAFRPDLDPATATDPLNTDTDGDDVADGLEDLNANGCVDSGETDPLVSEDYLLFADSFSDGTRAGDPSWKRVRGSWSVTGVAKRYTSTSAVVNLALIADPDLGDFRSGRIESSIILTRAYTKAPEARIVFHYQDATHYRYVRLTSTGVSIGQVGSNPIEEAGVKASLRRRYKVNTGYRLRVDIEGGTDVKVYTDNSATPLLSFRFTVSSSGQVGFRTEGAKSLFDDAAVWSDFALQ